jgi:hypothetical protein
MSLAVKFVKYGVMSAVCAVMFPSLLQAQSAQVQAGGEQALDVQTPQTAGASGISFAVGSPGNVSVYTNGFLLCTNVGTPSSSNFVLRSQHEDQSTSGSLNRWTFATATDLGPISYTGTALPSIQARYRHPLWFVTRVAATARWLNHVISTIFITMASTTCSR